MTLDRRTLLVGGGAGIGLIVAWKFWPGGMRGALASDASGAAFGNFIRVAPDGKVTIAVPQVETGQGAWTALPQIAASELGADWESVGVEPAPLAAAYRNPMAEDEGWLAPFGPLRAFRLKRDGGLRVTAGATSVRAFEAPLRDAAASARAMLVSAAAGRWGADEGDCSARDGGVFWNGQRLGFGELAEEAASLSPPRSPSRSAGGGTLTGQPLARLDGPAKATGSWRFASDVRLPDMLFASARVAPPGGRLVGFDRRAIDGAPGIRHLSVRDGWIALAAESWWQAERALHAANPRFTAAAAGEPRALFDDALANGDYRTVADRGDYDGTVQGSRALAATYYVAPAQHLALEPESATARMTGGTAELWAASQAPGLASAAVDDGTFYPMPVGEPAGRAMGGRAASIALAIAPVTGRPVQVVLSPATGQSHDPLSPGALVRMTALPGAGGITAAMRMDFASVDGIAASLARLDENDGTAAAAIGGETIVPTYAIPHLSVRTVAPALPFAVGYMRGSPIREAVFATESFIDELAHAAGLAPLDLRMALLGANGRLARCLQAAARRAGWDGGLPGSGMGIAGTSAFDSHIALVAEASIGANQRVSVEKLTCAVDCGHAVNPGLVRQQVEGAMLWALAQSTVAPIGWKGGMPMARPLAATGLRGLTGTPKIDVVIVGGGDAPGGVSGLGALPLAPAVANAVFAATGKRMRSLPFDPMGA